MMVVAHQISLLYITSLLGLLLLAQRCDSFVAGPPAPFLGCTSTALQNDKFRRDIDEKSRQKASASGGSVAAGAILGGLVGGPFGALFGASIGSNLGAKQAFDQARKEEMRKKGITQEMLDAAEEVGYALEQSFEGMEATRESLRSQQTLARRIDEDANSSYEKAKEAMAAGKEEEAKSFLLKRHEHQEYLKTILVRCAEEKSRIEVMERNVDALQKRALEVEAMLQRAVGAKARQDSSDLVGSISDTDFSLSREDPLLQKFKDLGID
ncbi:unnamed protein product [Pseudo-nitzschia multistriata]|uniref:Glycine zipper domain-containing protein n=1 Tax=Pseudo-nitzschia multistriata TaxID=183589 RepID=A0A448YW83_9STRA|nr:unnamed protein product [Pseudo-nitzschia multistriata]